MEKQMNTELDPILQTLMSHVPPVGAEDSIQTKRQERQKTKDKRQKDNKTKRQKPDNYQKDSLLL